MMEDYLIKIGTTKLKYILRGGYEIQENQPIVLAEATMADGTKRQNIAEKKKTIISITFSQITGDKIQEYNELWKNDFEATYWSKDNREYKESKRLQRVRLFLEEHSKRKIECKVVEKIKGTNTYVYQFK